MADPCMIGVKMKIHRFHKITMGGNAGGVWNIDREHSAPISWSFLAYRALCMMVGLSEPEMVHLFCKIVHLHDSMLSTTVL